MTDQAELFELDTETAALLDHLGGRAPEEIRHRWPQTLADMMDVVGAALRHAGADAPTALRYAAAAMAALAEYHGARMWYLPRGDQLKTALRNEQLYAEWGRHSPRELAERYGLTLQQTYAILREQSALHRRRVQPDLFGEQ